MALHVLDEANRCLGCKKPMCQEGCPIHTNYPGGHPSAQGKQMDAAGRMLFENNPLTTVCSLVCNHESSARVTASATGCPATTRCTFPSSRTISPPPTPNKMTAGPAPKNGMKPLCGLRPGRPDHRGAAGTLGLRCDHL